MARLRGFRSLAQAITLGFLVRATIAQSCTGTASSGLPATCGASQSGNIGTYTDACGSNYTIFCSSDSQPGPVGTATALTIQACMQACDGYSGCVAAVLQGSTCSFKTQLTTISTAANSIVLVKYAPNPAYPSPVPAASYVNASTGCGSALPAGLSPYGQSVRYSIISPADGLNRTYLVKIPQYYSANAASPLILAFPGHGSSAAAIEQLTGLSGSSYNSYGIVVYVDPYGPPGGFESDPDYAPGGIESSVNDISFVKNLIANMTASFCIDTGAIMATGHDNGGGLVNVLACDPVTSISIAVFAPNSAAVYSGILSSTNPNVFTMRPLGTPVQGNCTPGRNNVPIIEFHGTNDNSIPYLGSITQASYALPAIPHWVQAWSVRQGYGNASISTNIATTVQGDSVTMFQFGGNSGALGIVTHYQLGNWTHNWPNPGIDNTAPINAGLLAMNYMYTFTNYTRTPVFNPPNSTVGVLPTASPTSSTTSSSSTSSSSTSSSSTSSSSTSSSSISTSVSTSSGSSATSGTGSSLSTSNVIHYRDHECDRHYISKQYFHQPDWDTHNDYYYDNYSNFFSPYDRYD
ncbi:hypothetical protein LTR78_006983 [Recurvomyces mirabilis]|uniref:feruloyl esterase n=1 Tax=Recurvomyces mirabilis TaxID=574656 RepID=A0AAE0WK11_9PEZI|nr:hypothetical protein LTR78_006983 [Recurvomyces mirabilis]KAK5153367.1 hypothetical protein LTS14_007536 [Recurvomyces mirabilis]